MKDTSCCRWRRQRRRHTATGQATRDDRHPPLSAAARPDMSTPLRSPLPRPEHQGRPTPRSQNWDRKTSTDDEPSGTRKHPRRIQSRISTDKIWDNARNHSTLEQYKSELSYSSSKTGGLPQTTKHRELKSNVQSTHEVSDQEAEKWIGKNVNQPSREKQTLVAPHKLPPWTKMHDMKTKILPPWRSVRKNPNKT